MEVIEEDVPKLCKRYDSVFLNVMFLENILEIFLVNGLARLGKRFSDVVWRDVTAAVCIEIFKKCLEPI